MANDDCLVSLASLWEISIKFGLGKLRLPRSPEKYLPEQIAMNGFTELAIDFRHVVAVSVLPDHHRDPFDRLLVSHAKAEDLAIVSRNPVFERYGLKRVW